MSSEHDAGFLRRVLDLSSGIVFVVGPDLVLTYANQAGLDLVGYELDEVIGRSVLDFVDVDWNPLAIESIGTALSSDGGERQPMTFRAIAKDGSRPIARATANVQIDDPAIGGLVVYCERWTEQWFLDRAFESVAAGEPIGRTLELLIEVAGAETMDALGWFAAQPRGDRFDLSVAHHDLPPELAAPTATTDDEVASAWAGLLVGDEARVVDLAELPRPLRTPAQVEGMRSLWIWPADAVRGDQLEVWAVAWRSEPRVDAEETKIELMNRLANLAGLALRRSLDDERNEHAATHDAMTGLWNRNAVFDKVAEALARDPDGPGVGVVYLDLDRFKNVNDLYGHAAGDRVLEEIARRLRNASPVDGRVGRFGGDEFVYAGPAADLAEVEEFAAQLIADLLAPIELRSGEVVRVGASTGAAFARPGSVTADQLVERADAELYRIKHDHGDRRTG